MFRDKCKQVVDCSYRDFDAHGSFWVSAEKSCDSTVHRAGFCKNHFDAYLKQLKTSVEYHKESAKRLDEEWYQLSRVDK